MGLAGVGNITGMALAGFLSIVVHNYICANFIHFIQITTLTNTWGYES